MASGALIALVVGTVVFITVASPGRAPAIDRFEQRAGTLVALDGAGQPIWSFTVPRTASANGIALWPHLRAALPLDLDGDAHLDLVAIVNFERYPRGSTPPTIPSFGATSIHGVSSQGQLLWSFTPTSSFTFGGRSFAAPWMPRTWLVHEPPDAGVWISFIHPTWWPSFVIRLDAEGESALTFVNAGHVESLGRVKTGRGAYLLVGGINNEYRSAAFAVLADGESATSPQGVGSPFICETCPEGDPNRYFVFPRSEVNVAQGNSHHFVTEFASSQTGAFEVTIREKPEPQSLRSIYRFSADLEPEGVAMSDAYWEAHDRLFQEGELDHSSHECPERIGGTRVRVWDAGSGWQEMVVPPTFAAAPSSPTSPVQ